MTTTTFNNASRHPKITAVLAKLHPSLQPLQHWDHARLIYSLAERLANTVSQTPALIIALHHLHLAQEAVVAAGEPTSVTLDEWAVTMGSTGINH